MTDSIQAPDISIAIGGMPVVRCFLTGRGLESSPRFDIVDEGIRSITGSMLTTWFEENGFASPQAKKAAQLCCDATWLLYTT